MGRSIIAGLAVVFALVVFGGAVYAQGQRGYGMICGTNLNLAEIEKFQEETLSLRNELLTKRLELQNEYCKTKLDYDRIATLRKEIVDIQTKIHAAADKYGLSAIGGSFGMRSGMMMGKGMMGCPCSMTE